MQANRIKFCESCGREYVVRRKHMMDAARYCSRPCFARGRFGHPVTPPNPSGLCQCGCGEKVSIAGRTDRKTGTLIGHPVRFVTGHQHRKSGIQWIEEDRGYSSPCWIWQLARKGRGYASMYVNGKYLSAHRVFYERSNGEITAGFQLHHLCEVKECVNPDHLVALSPGDHAKLHPSPHAEVSDAVSSRNPMVTAQ